MKSEEGRRIFNITQQHHYTSIQHPSPEHPSIPRTSIQEYLTSPLLDYVDDFPVAVATSEVLKASETCNKSEQRQLFLTGLVSAVFKFCQSGLKLFASSVGAGLHVGQRAVVGVGAQLSLALVGIGYIVGLNVGVLIVMGGVISWFVAIPVYMHILDPEELAELLEYGHHSKVATGYDAAILIWGSRIRFIGVGAMFIGGMYTILCVSKPLWHSFRHGLFHSKRRDNIYANPIDRDLPLSGVLLGIFAMILPLFIFYVFGLTEDHFDMPTTSYWICIFALILFTLLSGFIFSAIAGYTGGLIGSSNNPLTNMVVSAVLFSCLIIYSIASTELDFMGPDGATKVRSAAGFAVIVGGVVVSAASSGGDNLQDLKTGQLVGATPWKQQVVQVLGVIAASITVPLALSVLSSSYGIGNHEGHEHYVIADSLQAPHAEMLKFLAENVFMGEVYWDLLGAGGLISLLVILIDLILAKLQCTFRMPVLAFAVGLYLPLALTVPILIGSLVAFFSMTYVYKKASFKPEITCQALEASARRGLLFASGLISGEAFVGILLAIPYAFLHSQDIMRIVPHDFTIVQGVLGSLAALAIIAWLVHTVCRHQNFPQTPRVGLEDGLEKEVEIPMKGNLTLSKSAPLMY